MATKIYYEDPFLYIDTKRYTDGTNLEWNTSFTVFSLWNTSGSVRYEQVLSDVVDKADAPYANSQAFQDSISDFFVKASGDGGTTDNTTEGFIPVKIGDAFENSALQETVDEVVSSKPIRASVIAPTGTIFFENALEIQSNSDMIEVFSCVNNHRHEMLHSNYTDAGSELPHYHKKGVLQTTPVQLLEDEQLGSFQFVLGNLLARHWKDFIIKPKAAGQGKFTVRDVDENGCIMVTETIVDIGIGALNTEFLFTLSNRVQTYAGQTVWASYEGPDIAGHTYVSDPIYGSQFVPFLKIDEQPWEKKFIAEQDEIITSAERSKLALITDTGSGHIITDAERSKLAGLDPSTNLGVFLTLLDLQTAHPTANLNDNAVVTSPEPPNNIPNEVWFWGGSSWDPSGGSTGGDMLKSIYDPSGIGADAFNMANMVENGTHKILTDTERLEIAANTTHKSSDGKDHSDVLANNNHRSVVAGNPHNVKPGEIIGFQTEVSANSDVVLNTTHRNSDGKDHSDVVLNNAKVSFPEAPSDGTQYTRKDGAWEENEGDPNNISDVDATDLTDSGETTLHYHNSDRNRANHTGTQGASTISDFDTEVSNNTTVQANTSKVSADGSVTTHNDVTSAGSGAIITSPERTNLSNQSNTNTGDETTSSIKAKRPLKTVNGNSLEGSGNVDIISTPKHSRQTLTFDTTQDWNVSAGTWATLTLTANCTFDIPTNLEAGADYKLTINTSTFNITSWNTIFEWVGGNAPVLPVNSRVTILFQYDGTRLEGVMNGGFSS